MVVLENIMPMPIYLSDFKGFVLTQPDYTVSVTLQPVLSINDMSRLGINQNIKSKQVGDK